MKKTIIAVALAALVLWLAAPYITGSIAESETRSLIARINQDSLQYGATEISSYERGVRNSTILYSYSLPPALAAMTGFEGKLEYQCAYDHGMIGIEFDCNFSDDPSYQKLIERHFGGKNPIKITGAISAFGGLTQKISVIPIEQTTESGAVVKLAASEILVESDSEMSEYAVKGTIGAANIIDKERDFSAGPIEIDMDFAVTALGLYAGRYAMFTDKLVVTDEGHKVEVKGLAFEGTATERNETMDSISKLTFKSAVSSQSDEMKIENAALSFDFLGVNSQALLEYQEFARRLQTDLMANLEHGGESEMDPNQMMAMLPVIEKMLDKGLNIKFATALELDGKSNSFNFQLELLDKMGLSQIGAFMFDPESVLEKLNVGLSTQIDRSLLEANAAAKQSIDNSGLFQSQDDNYSLDIQLGAKSSLNGEPVTVQELQGLLIGSMMSN